MEQSKTDSAVADRLLKNPAQAISEAAGRPLPEGIRVIASRGADGKSVMLKPEVDPAFKGELDEKVLDAVSGGGDYLSGYHKS
jgi:hypothetical protein